ncbi:MAG: Crp/Fnr family transcriptional regulator [Acidobacteriaceae bacterium]
MPLTTGNLLLDALSPPLQAEILSLGRTIDLPSRTMLREQNEKSAYAYFLLNGVASQVITMVEGSTAEVGLTGHEGIVGAMQLLGPTPTPSQSSMLLPGSALRVRCEDLCPLFLTNAELRSRILEFLQQQSITLEQTSACNRLHLAEPRLIRWLLMCYDRSHQDTMSLTQEFMANMLGTRRTTVTLLAGSLQKRGLISYRRGKVTLLAHQELERAACHCYQICRRALHNLYQTSLQP